MNEEKSFGRWSLTSGDLMNMTPVKARDLIRKCFLEAQKETFSRLREKAGKVPTIKEITESVDRIVRHAFRETDSDYENPTKEQIKISVEFLAKGAKSWGTPEDIINHHIEQISQILDEL